MRLFKTLISITVILMNMSFDTKPEEKANAVQDQKPLFSFGLIADVQYADSEPAGTRYYKSSLNKLRESLSVISKDSVDFVITLGDLIDRDYKSYKPVLSILDSSGLKFFHVTGNHDYSVYPVYKKRLPAEYTNRPGYYSFSHSNFRFIFLNGNEISTYSSNSKMKIKKAGVLLDSLKIRGESNAVEWNGGISDKQLLWLDNQINEAHVLNEKAFIFCHFPVFPENVHNLLNYRDILIVLGKYKNTIAWFNGHNHEGNYGKLGMTHFVTIKGMVETERENSFATIDVYRNRIRIVGSGREKNQILDF